jgi:hypothetical protein
MPVVIRDEFADFEIDGEVIAGPVTTRYSAAGGGRPRWFEATLYRKPDGSYVLHQASLSVVWHLDEFADSHVRKPGEVRRDRLPAGAVYCGSLPDRGQDRCPPHRPPPRGEIVIIELPQHKAVSLPDAGAVIREAMTARRGNGAVSMAMSDPMRELLTEAEGNDPAFRGIRPVMRMLCRLRQTAPYDQESRWRTRHWLTGSGRAPGCPARHRTRQTTTRIIAAGTCGSG